MTAREALVAVAAGAAGIAVIGLVLGLMALTSPIP